MFYDNFVRLCNSVNKAPSAVAMEIGLSRASVNGWKKGKKPTDATIIKIADYFSVSCDELLGNEKEPATDSDGFTAAERRDIAVEVERMMADLEHQGDLMFDGDPATPEALESIRTAFMIGLTHARQLNKQGKKYKFPDLPKGPKEE